MVVNCVSWNPVDVSLVGRLFFQKSSSVQLKSGGTEAVFVFSLEWGVLSWSDGCTSITVWGTYCTMTEKSFSVGERFSCRWWMRILWLCSALLKRGGLLFSVAYPDFIAGRWRLGIMPLGISSTEEDTVTSVLRLARYYSCVVNVHLWPFELVLVIWS